ncbi:hypothetical protein QBC38DRAFT_457589 [Podospora fimiseda]|uniref:Peptidase S8/S53 domain-containing protein n=1 Tax=Podospora fimiseda TaxID=252190 RepID=A0AAN7BKU3_9PEZI|nr:hypothetical protein QBC38DRAFT_457589 [Podospora fimiseda]
MVLRGGKRSGNQGHARDAPRPTSIESVLSDAKTVGDKFHNPESQECKDFEEKHHVRLSNLPSNSVSYGGNAAEDDVLHRVAKDLQDFDLWYEPFTQWAIRAHPQLLQFRDAGGSTPLHIAIMNENHQFVALVLDYVENIRSLLEMKTSLSLNCLHTAILHQCPYTEQIIKKSLELERNHSTPSHEKNVQHEERDQGFGSGTQFPDDMSISHTADDSIFTVIPDHQDLDHTYSGEVSGQTPLHLAVTFDAGPEAPDSEDSLDTADAPPSSSNSHSFSNLPRRVSDLGLDIGKSNPVIDEPIDVKSPHQSSRRLSTHMLLAVNGTGGKKSSVATGAEVKSSKQVSFDDDGPKEIARDHDKAASSGGGNHEPRFEPPRQHSRATTCTSTRIPTWNATRVVRRLVEARPGVLLWPNAQKETPFQHRLRLVMEPDENDHHSQPAIPHDRDMLVNEDRILSYLREYIIDNFSRRDAMKALYKIGEERTLETEFDLSGLPYSTIGYDFLNGLGNVLRFEGLLKYVALPRLSIRKDDIKTENGHKSLVTGSKPKGLRDMETVFQWMRDSKVQSILKVAVVDDVEPSHSEESIENCVENFDVRIWNWYKLDLCCSVITRKAPRARDVTLYWSGNNAVLMGWGSPAGLPSLKHPVWPPKQLKRVNLYICEGLESTTRLEENLDNFKSALFDHIAPRTLEFSWGYHKPGTNYHSLFRGPGKGKATESKWMRTMKDFAEFLRDAKPGTEIEPVKIAVIDDGIDLGLDIFQERVQVGESFYQLSDFSGRLGAYYVPSGSHGTLMAQLICEVCPVVQLYIAQVEVLPGQDGRRSFTAESATEAIRWAVDQKVDIISMSWSINPRPETTKGLEEALNAASGDKIIMFCSSIDEGPTTMLDTTYPGKSGKCIKIGAATGFGTKLSWVSEANSDFLLPGESLQPAADLKLWGDHHPGSFGSSVSTALAAGLAGVILYCDRLVGTHVTKRSLPKESSTMSIPTTSAFPGVGAMMTSPLRPPRSPLAKGGRHSTNSVRNTNVVTDYLRNDGNMRKAFSNLSVASETRIFPEVWDFIPSQTADDPLVWDERRPGLEEKTKATMEKLDYFLKAIKK